MGGGSVGERRLFACARAGVEDADSQGRVDRLLDQGGKEGE